MTVFELSLAVCLAAFMVHPPEITDDWFLVAPPGVGATVEMPGIPAFQQQQIRPVRDMDEILVRTRSSVMNNGNTSLTFVYHDELKTPRGRVQVSRVLDGAMTGAIALVNGELVTQEEIFRGNYKGRDFLYTCEVSDAKLQTMHVLKIRTQIILVEKRLYSLNYISLKSNYEEDVAERFFKSFQLVKTPSDLPPKPRVGRSRKLANEPRDPKLPVAKAPEPIRPEKPLVEESDGDATTESDK